MKNQIKPEPVKETFMLLGLPTITLLVPLVVIYVAANGKL